MCCPVVIDSLDRKCSIVSCVFVMFSETKSIRYITFAFGCLSRQNGMGLIVALGEEPGHDASGTLFWDDGESHGLFDQARFIWSYVPRFFICLFVSFACIYSSLVRHVWKWCLSASGLQFFWCKCVPILFWVERSCVQALLKVLNVSL